MLNLAARQASKSCFKFRVGAVIVKGGRVLATGFNAIRYVKERIPKKHIESLHAEQAAILKLLKARRFSDLAGSTLYVCRLTKQDSPALAKPCSICQQLIQSVGIRKVIYSQ